MSAYWRPQTFLSKAFTNPTLPWLGTIFLYWLVFCFVFFPHSVLGMTWRNCLPPYLELFHRVTDIHVQRVRLLEFWHSDAHQERQLEGPHTTSLISRDASLWMSPCSANSSQEELSPSAFIRTCTYLVLARSLLPLVLPPAKEFQSLYLKCLNVFLPLLPFTMASFLMCVLLLGSESVTWGWGPIYLEEHWTILQGQCSSHLAHRILEFSVGVSLIC